MRQHSCNHLIATSCRGSCQHGRTIELRPETVGRYYSIDDPGHDVAEFGGPQRHPRSSSEFGDFDNCQEFANLSQTRDRGG